MTELIVPPIGGKMKSANTLSKMSTKKFQNKVKDVQKQISFRESASENTPKGQFIDKYGIQLDMPANYIYTTFFYQPDINYIISANCQIFPDNMTFYDYDKLDTNQDPLDNDFVQKESELSGCMSFKTYQYESNKFQQKNIRTCDPAYLHKLCFSEDRTKLAVFRKEKSLIGNMFTADQPLVVDIFDCSSIDFFLKKEMLTPKDTNLILTIRDPHLYGSSKIDKAFIRFSQNHKYLYVSYLRKHIMIYDIHQKEVSQLTTPVFNIELPAIYECIINIGINEQSIQDSVIAAKKTDFRNIEFFTLAYIQEITGHLAGSVRASISQYDLQKIQSKYPISSIRLNEFDIDSTNLRFSADQSTALFCDKNQNIQLDLASHGKKQHQKTIRHLNGKICRYIARFEDEEFLIATANNQDKEICIRHSSDSEKKIKFYFRFASGSTEVRDIYTYDDKIRILVTRDDEEFIIYEFQDFEEKHTFWQRFLESSNYIFEWPYVCYLKGQTHIIIQNAYRPGIAFFIELKSTNSDEQISNMFVTDQYYLYLVLQTKTNYQIFEKDLDKCMTVIFNSEQRKIATNQLNSPDVRRLINKGNSSALNSILPIATISKDYIENHSIYKFFVRSASTKEIIQTNQERIIFFLCNFKIYSIIGKKTQVIDTGYKFRQITQNQIAYNTVDSKGKKTNEIKYLTLGTSDYVITKVYEEMEGKLVEFLVSDKELLIVSKSEASEYHQVKIFEINSSLQAKLKCTIQTQDEDMIGAFQTVNFFQNNMIPSGNDLYTIVQNGDQTFIHTYKNIINLPKSSGNDVTFTSPFMNFTYRKMIYFIINKKFLKPKKGLILPYINDNYQVFNKRDNLTQYCQFFEYRHPVTLQQELDILTYVPFTKQILHYNQKGQLKQMFSLKKLFQTYGETTIAQSTDGHYFLQINEDDQDSSQLTIMKMDLKINEPFSSDKFSSPKASSSMSAQEINKRFIESQQTQNVEKQTPEAGFFLEEIIDLSQIQVRAEEYQAIGKTNVKSLVEYFRAKHCEVFYKLNDNLDILIGFLYANKANKEKLEAKYLKELLLIKKESGDKRSCFKVRINGHQNPVKQIKIEASIKTEDKSDFRQQLLGIYHVKDKPSMEEEEFQMFITMNELEGCNDVCMTNEKIILWSSSSIYNGDLSSVNSNEASIKLRKSKFQIENLEEAQICNVSANGQNIDDLHKGNYYVYLKLLMDQYSFFIKYNINKDKEFSSFDCSNDAMIFYDTRAEGYILDKDSMVDIDQGIPLYFYKTGTHMFRKQYLLGSVIDKGPRFCKKNIHFLVRNRVYIPYNYFIFVIFENNVGRGLQTDNYDPEAFYQIEGSTILHQFSNNFKILEFILNQYEKQNPKLLNMILLKNKDNENVLQLALKNQNSRCVNLILNKLSKISMNNIHALKQNFEELLNYNGFEDYIRLCFFQTDQMKSKQIFCRKSENEDDQFFISTHETSFLDKNFFNNFQDTSQPSKQVIIRGLDAGWILKHNIGVKFQTKLSESDNMNYFSIDTVRLIVNYQWKLMKPMIIKWLFFPFILNMVIYNFYCVFVFENRKLNPDHQHYKVLMAITQISLLLFTIQTVYVELKQIQFHRQEYIQSFWNILDLTTVVLAPLTVLLDFIDFDERKIRPLMAFCNLIFYLRFFYFLRIFDSSAHLIRTIIEITSDIRNFLFVFMLGIIGFGATFQILSNNNNYPEYEDAIFIESFIGGFIYSYLLSLGEFNMDSFNDSQDRILIWLLFILCSMFTTIILLNMLVAIMGESFNRVNEQSENQRVREHLQLIVENDFLIERSTFFGDVKFLIEIKDDVGEGQEEAINQQYKELQEIIKAKDDSQKKDMADLREMMKHENQQILSLKNDIASIKKMLMNQSSSNQDEAQYSSLQSFGSISRRSRQA